MNGDDSVASLRKEFGQVVADRILRLAGFRFHLRLHLECLQRNADHPEIVEKGLCQLRLAVKKAEERIKEWEEYGGLARLLACSVFISSGLPYRDLTSREYKFARLAWSVRLVDEELRVIMGGVDDEP